MVMDRFPFAWSLVPWDWRDVFTWRIGRQSATRLVAAPRQAELGLLDSATNTCDSRLIV
jgi:hypothetical protein